MKRGALMLPSATVSLYPSRTHMPLEMVSDSAAQRVPARIKVESGATMKRTFIKKSNIVARMSGERQPEPIIFRPRCKSPKLFAALCVKHQIVAFLPTHLLCTMCRQYDTVTTALARAEFIDLCAIT